MASPDSNIRAASDSGRGLVSRRRLQSVDHERRRGVPVTTRARTVLDCADEHDAEAIRDAALQRGMTATSLIGALDRMPSAPGRPAARALVEPVLDGGVLKPERDLLRGLRRAGAAEWTAGARVEARGPRYWLGLSNVRVRLAVEVDGWTVHAQSTAVHDDRRRQNDLIRAGWTVPRYTPGQLRGRVPTVVAEIMAVEAGLRRQRASPPAEECR